MVVVRKNQDMIPALLNEFFGNYWNGGSMQKSSQPMNIKETDKNYELEMPVPGLTKEDLGLEVDQDNNLIILMHKKEESKEDKKGDCYLRHEFSTFEGQHSFVLPEDVDKKKITAKVDKGLLFIYLPKMTPDAHKALTQTIAIE